jgi:hypothetical protein
MNVRTLAALGLLSLAATSGSAWDDWCRVRAPRDATVDARGAESLRVDARAGSLRIVGERGLDQVVVQGRACATDKETLESIRLRADRSGREVRVVVEIPERTWRFSDSGGGLDLEIRVPAALAADVKDSSGEAEVSGVASLRIEDASGSLRIRDVAGDVWVRDGSGELTVEHVGNLEVDDDGSGSIDVRDVKRSVLVREDGSGGIDIRDVLGSVTIGKSGSGGVRVDNVRGDFKVDQIGSGGIEHSRVGGRIDVPEDRHARRERERAERERERALQRAERERERAEQLRERELERAERERERAEQYRERERQRAERWRYR